MKRNIPRHVRVIAETEAENFRHAARLFCEYEGDLEHDIREAIEDGILRFKSGEDASQEARMGSMRHDVEPAEADRPMQHAPPAVESGENYVKAFYAIAEVLGIGAQTCSPKDVFETKMLPKLREAVKALAEVERFRSERSYVVGFNDGFAHAREGGPA